jgi:ornithine cyclodeaminase
MPDPALSFLYLSEPDAIAAGVTDMPACVDAMDETLRLLKLGDYRMAGKEGDSHGAMVSFPASSPFPNMPVDGPDRRFMAMPAYLGGSFDLAGMKWYGSNLANRERGLPRSILMFMLNDKETGAPLMLMSANLLSAYRTGAVPGVGARYLARPDAHVAAIIGPGVMGKTGLEAYAAVRDITTVKVVGRRRESAEAYRDWVAARLPQVREVIVCDSLAEAVEGADIIHSGVSGPSGSHTYPHIKTEWLKPGAFICSVANLKLEDGLLTDPATGRFTDNRRMYEDWQAEYEYPVWEKIGVIGNRLIDLVFEGKLGLADVTDIGDVALGRAAGRLSDDQIIVYSVGGMPIEDISWGACVYRSALERGIGVRLPLWDAPALA